MIWLSNFLVLGRETQTPLDVVLNLPTAKGEVTNYDDYATKLNERLRYAYDVVRSHLGYAAQRAKRYYDLRVKPRRYEPGQWVSYYNPRHFRGRQDKWSRKFTGPFLVLDVLPPVNLKLQRSSHSKPFIVHDKVKLWTGEAPKSWVPNISEQEKFDIIGLPLAPVADATKPDDENTDHSVVEPNEATETDHEENTATATIAPHSEQSAVVAPLETDNVAVAYEADEVPLSRPQQMRKRPAHLAGYCTD